MKKFLFISSLVLSSFGLTVSAKEKAKFKEVYSQNFVVSTDAFNTELRIIEDTQTSVQYIYIQHGVREDATIAICPRYRLDGTLFK